MVIDIKSKRFNTIHIDQEFKRFENLKTRKEWRSKYNVNPQMEQTSFRFYSMAKFLLLLKQEISKSANFLSWTMYAVVSYANLSIRSFQNSLFINNANFVLKVTIFLKKLSFIFNKL